MAQAINNAPPTLIEREEGVVLTEEMKVGGINDVCRTLGIGCIDVVGMLAAEGLTMDFQPPP